MKSFILMIALFSTLTVQAHTCPDGSIHFDTVHGCLSFEFTEGPHINQRGQRKLSAGIAKVVVYDSGIDLDKAFFYVWMKMPNMEHGGRPLTTRHLGNGVFEIENILLSQMTGQWFLRLDLSPKAPHNPGTDYDGEFAITDWL